MDVQIGIDKSEGSDSIMSKKDISELLGISLATINNWIKVGIFPMPNLYDSYSREVAIKAIDLIKKSQSKLNSRANRSQANKKFITYLGITGRERKELLSSIILKYEKSSFSIDEAVLALIIAMLKYNRLYIENSSIYKKIQTWLVELCRDENIGNLFLEYSLPNKDDDFIGAFYQSIRSISEKSQIGSYYTPSDLLSEIHISNEKTVIDPFCGSGGILLRIIDKNHDPHKIWAFDIDKTALMICEANLVLFFNNPYAEPNIQIKDSIFDEFELFSCDYKNKYDYVVSNPPWGSKISKKQKDKLLSLHPDLNTTEVFSIALKNCFKMLSNSGDLYFLLPNSFLNVSAHRNIRRYLINKYCEISIYLLGNAFKGVLSESILLHIKKGSSRDTILIQNRNNEHYEIDKKNLSPPDYLIPIISNNYENTIIDLIFSNFTGRLENCTDFALGIVTGNNAKHLLRKPLADSEPIYRGKDIIPYFYKNPECFISFNPNIYQQVAPIRLYRSRKIVYRFISDKIVCAIDEEGHLILNSANLFIPKNYQFETIVCLFNSPIYAFIFKKKFHSRKVLRSHIEELPLPILAEEQHKDFLAFYLEIKKDLITQDEIDNYICNLAKLNNSQYAYIKESVYGKAH